MSTAMTSNNHQSYGRGGTGNKKFINRHDASSTMKSSMACTNATTSLLDVIRSQGSAMLAAEIHHHNVSAAAANTGNGSKSRPIRISSHHNNNNRQHKHDATASEEDYEDFGRTSEELERFYDEATWRMYMLIQSARRANEQQRHHFHTTTTSHHHHHRVPTTSHSHAQYYYQQPATAAAVNSSTQHAIDWTTQRPAIREDDEEKEGIFDLEL